MQNNADTVTKIGHFYYCLLAGIRLKMNEGDSLPDPVMKRYVQSWLNHAKKYKIFDVRVASDILWLESEIKKEPFYVFYKKIRKVYHIIHN